MRDFAMENATNSSNLRFCLTVSPPQPPQAMIDLRLELGNKRFFQSRLDRADLAGEAHAG
jgi:hypothetical protein